MAKNKELTQEEYFSKPEIGVKRGDLLQVLTGMMEDVNSELSRAFKVMAQSYITSEVVLKLLIEKGLITEQDIADAKKAYANEANNTEKEDKKDGSE
jgi:hypothetical protein